MGREKEALDFARRNKFCEVIDIISTEDRFDINYKDRLGRSLLIYAATLKDLEAVKFLLKKGAKINDRDFMGKTALHYAAILNISPEEDNVVKILINNGAHLDASDANGQTPFQVAVQSNNISIADLLLTKNKISLDIDEYNEKIKILNKISNYYQRPKCVSGLSKKIEDFNFDISTKKEIETRSIVFQTNIIS